MESTTPILLTEDGGLTKTILREGTGAQIPPRAKANVHYVGTLLDGKQFDSSRERGQPFNFSLGQGSVIKGWDLGVATMKQGELCKLTCSHEYAYGEAGSPPTIPPKSTLIFEVELLGWDDPEPDTAAEKIKIATKKKEEGNRLFKEEKYDEASKAYSKALDYFKESWGFSDQEKKRSR